MLSYVILKEGLFCLEAPLASYIYREIEREYKKRKLSILCSVYMSANIFILEFFKLMARYDFVLPRTKFYITKVFKKGLICNKSKNFRKETRYFKKIGTKMTTLI